MRTRCKTRTQNEAAGPPLCQLLVLAKRDDKVVNEEPLLTDLNQRIRDVRVFQDGAVYVLTDGAGGKLLKLTPNNSQTRQ